MSTFQALIFPDTAFIDSDYVKSSLVYFDKILIPHIAHPIDVEILRESWGNLSAKWKIDLESALDRYSQVVKVIDRVKELQEHGVVETAPPEAFANSICTGSEIFNETFNDNPPDESDLAAAKEACSWVEDSFSASSSESSEHAPLMSYVNYWFKSIQRMLIAEHTGSFVVASNMLQFHALRRIQAAVGIKLGQPVKQLRAEAMRMVLPNLIVRDLSEVLEVRSKLKDFLEPFRIEMNRVLASLPTDLSVDKMQLELQKAIDRDVAPKIHELERYMNAPGQTVTKHLISGSTGISTAAATLIGSATVGFELSSLAACAPFLHLLTAAMKAKFERHERLRDNPYTFALLANRRRTA